MIADLLFLGDHTVRSIAVTALIIFILVFAYALEKIAEAGKRDRKE